MSVKLNRRQAFKVMIGLGGTAVSAMLPKPVQAAEEHPAHPIAPPDAIAMLYDSTCCTGC